MLALLQNDEAIYRAMIRDIYGMGLVQQRKKYKFIRCSYLSFIIGLMVAPLSALVEYLLAKG